MASNSTVDWCLGETSTYYINCGLWPAIAKSVRWLSGVKGVAWRVYSNIRVRDGGWEGNILSYGTSLSSESAVSKHVRFHGNEGNQRLWICEALPLPILFSWAKEGLWFRPLVHWVLQFHISSDGDLDEMFTDFFRWLANLLKVTVPRQSGTYIFFATNKANIWQAVRAAVLKRLKSCPCLNRRCDCVWLNETKTRRLFDMFCRCCAWCRTFSFLQSLCFAFLALVLFSTPFGLAACTALEKKRNTLGNNCHDRSKWFKKALQHNFLVFLLLVFGLCDKKPTLFFDALVAFCFCWWMNKKHGEPLWSWTQMLARFFMFDSCRKFSSISTYVQFL